MSRHAVFIAGDRVLHAANPCGAGIQYQAHPQVLSPGDQLSPQRHETAETVLVVRDGQLEVMVNGAVGMVAAGSFVRIPPGTWFGYRNPGDVAARLLLRTSPPLVARGGQRITIYIAAA